MCRIAIVAPPSGLGDVIMARNAIDYLAKDYTVVVVHPNIEMCKAILPGYQYIDLGIRKWTKKEFLLWLLWKGPLLAFNLRGIRPYLTVQFEPNVVRRVLLWMAKPQYSFIGSRGYGCRYDLNDRLVGAK